MSSALRSAHAALPQRRASAVPLSGVGRDAGFHAGRRWPRAPHPSCSNQHVCHESCGAKLVHVHAAADAQASGPAWLRRGRSSRPGSARHARRLQAGRAPANQRLPCSNPKPAHRPGPARRAGGRRAPPARGDAEGGRRARQAGRGRLCRGAAGRAQDAGGELRLRRAGAPPGRGPAGLLLLRFMCAVRGGRTHVSSWEDRLAAVCEVGDAAGHSALAAKALRGSGRAGHHPRAGGGGGARRHGGHRHRDRRPVRPRDRWHL